MAAFAYRAADNTGRIVEGVLQGGSEAEALHALEQRSLTPLTIRQAKRKRGQLEAAAATTRIRLRTRELLELTRQLKVMLKSGITLLAALDTLRATATSSAYRRLLDRIAADIQSGASLSEALAVHPYVFDAFYLGTIRAGEAAGVHPEALDELIRYYERRLATRRQLINALTYPAIVVATLIIACIVMLTWVVPQFASLFSGMGGDLPMPTKILLGTSDFVTGYWPWLAGGVVGLAVGLWCANRYPSMRMAFGQALTRVPVFGSIIYLSTVVQFCRVIALLEAAGLPLLETLKITEEALLPGPVRKLTGQLRRKVAGGNAIAASVAGSNALPKLVEHMIGVGEKTGNIDELLTAAAEHYEEKMQIQIRRLTTAIEPAMVLVVSSLVLFTAMAIFLPIWKMNSMMLG